MVPRAFAGDLLPPMSYPYRRLTVIFGSCLYQSSSRLGNRSTSKPCFLFFFLFYLPLKANTAFRSPQAGALRPLVGLCHKGPAERRPLAACREKHSKPRRVYPPPPKTGRGGGGGGGAKLEGTPRKPKMGWASSLVSDESRQNQRAPKICLEGSSETDQHPSVLELDQPHTKCSLPIH